MKKKRLLLEYFVDNVAIKKPFMFVRLKILFDINLYEDKGLLFVLWLENSVLIVNICF